jgi:hypothetical protein
MEKAQGVFFWMMLLLAANTGVLLTMLRERIFFRAVAEELGRLLPAGYDPKRLSYPYMFTFLTPPAWKAALERHLSEKPTHAARDLWLRFRKLRHWLMGIELAMVVAFILWALLS